MGMDETTNLSFGDWKNREIYPYVTEEFGEK